jgi:hypothetical protein
MKTMETTIGIKIIETMKDKTTISESMQTTSSTPSEEEDIELDKYLVTRS